MKRWLYRTFKIWSPSLTFLEGRVVTKYGDPVDSKDPLAQVHAAMGREHQLDYRAIADGITQSIREDLM